MKVDIPDRLAESCQESSNRRAWLEQLPEVLRRLQVQWSLSLGQPFTGASCAWVAPVWLADGKQAVLKLGMPHFEAEQEAAGLRFWDGEAWVRLLEVDAVSGAMLIECCRPGTSLRERPESAQDAVIAGLLKQTWRRPTMPHPFRPLAEMLNYWASETVADRARWTDTGLVEAGLQLFEKLPGSAPGEAVLATDLHAGNVLQAGREPWLAIDPKPFLGDPAYDATQHLFNCSGRLIKDAARTIGRFAELLEVPEERVRLWAFARAAAEPRKDWGDQTMAAIAAATAL